MTTLETPRLILRPFREEDVDLLSGLMANQYFMRFSLGVYTREQTIGFLEKLLALQNANKPSLFAAVLRSNGMLLGYCGFYHQHIDNVDEIEIGYRMHPDYWNKGLATEAARGTRSRFP
jgi:RimJ/RimL family protein N-acetyltransferase